MFGSKKAPPPRPSLKAAAQPLETPKAPAPAGARGQLAAAPRAQMKSPSIISEGTTISGGIKTQGDIQVDGHVEGDLVALSAVLGASAHLDGNLVAGTADIRGRVDGDCYAHHIRLAAGATVRGNLSCRTFEVEHGAKLEGTCRHLDDPLAAAPATATSR
jgi:cytoskeletal protein CcmA (bactofilin family)